jgi:uncharacterized protein
MDNIFCHVELSTDNLSRAKEFYGALFPSWKLEEVDMGGGKSYTMLRTNTATAGSSGTETSAGGTTGTSTSSKTASASTKTATSSSKTASASTSSGSSGSSTGSSTNAGTVGGGMQTHPMPGSPSNWLVYVEVERVDATLNRAEKLGGRVIVPRTPIPNMGYFGILQDPSGATFGVWEPGPQQRNP